MYELREEYRNEVLDKVIGELQVLDMIKAYIEFIRSISNTILSIRRMVGSDRGSEYIETLNQIVRDITSSLKLSISEVLNIDPDKICFEGIEECDVVIMIDMNKVLFRKEKARYIVDVFTREIVIEK